jgi:hypothetical protein
MNNKNNIKALAAVWDLSQGRHPYIAKRPNLYRANPFQELDAYEKYDIGITFEHCGHNVFLDNGYANLVDTTSQVPTSPLFVRDLTGRVIYIGYGPEFKDKSQWQADPQYTFPHNCREVTAEMAGADELENIFLTHFRCMDMTLEPTRYSAGNTEQQVAGFYPVSNLYPYKLRVDSFYIDGWKIPQTEMVFTRTVGIHPENAKDAAREFIRQWDSRPNGQSYVDFHKDIGGADYFKGLFSKGCTIIPAMGAKNGVRKVGANFEDLGAWPGQAVEGLHEIAEEQNSDAPAGTILEILRPGFVAGDQVEQAVVNVSNGSAYEDLNESDHDPYIPDLFLPHIRCSTTWGKTWIPTKPKHFDKPAIWGWDDQKGQFIQHKGPLWDPLHYYYSSVPKIIQCYEDQKDGSHAPTVPVEMKEVFHPVTEMKCFDTFSESAKIRRADSNNPIQSAIRSVEHTMEVCSIGYHPLPVQFEYEIDTFWMPKLSPRKRIAQDVPPSLAGRVLPVVEVILPLDIYKKSLEVPEDAIWITSGNTVRASSFDSLIDYPYLYRYLAKLSEEDIYEMAPVFLEDMPEKELNASVQNKWGSMDISDDLEPICPGFYDAFYSLQEKAKKRRINRYEFYKTNRNGYVLKWWQSEEWPEGDYVPTGSEKDVIWTSVITPPTV